MWIDIIDTGKTKHQYICDRRLMVGLSIYRAEPSTPTRHASCDSVGILLSRAVGSHSPHGSALLIPPLRHTASLKVIIDCA